MNNFLSRAEIEEVGEGLIQAYGQRFPDRVTQYVDIEHFITEYLSLRIRYVTFGEEDYGKIGFLADGETPLLIRQEGKVFPYVFPRDTIVLEKFLLSDKEIARRRFTLAHEAAHYILTKMKNQNGAGRFHNEFDGERIYTCAELAQIFSANEWQADAMGATILMPKRTITNALAKFNRSKAIKVYGDTTLSGKDKVTIRNMANYILVSYTALFIRLRDLKLLEYHDITEYISKELNLGGNL